MTESMTVRVTGEISLFVGLLYPHFVDHWYEYLYASPVGIIPCPTLMVVTGFTLLFLSKLPRRWLVTLLIADLFYAVFGIFFMKVAVDLFLFASIFGLVSLLYSKRHMKSADLTTSHA